jgi:hypothetical protein
VPELFQEVYDPEDLRLKLWIRFRGSDEIGDRLGSIGFSIELDQPLLIQITPMLWTASPGGRFPRVLPASMAARATLAVHRPVDDHETVSADHAGDARAWG